MRNERKIVFLIIALVLLSSCSSKTSSIAEETGGHFEKREGVDTYIEDGQVIVNSLVYDDGKLYYVDDKGHKMKDTWAKITNDGDYGYFGSLGDLVVNKIRDIDGKLYYFDEEGKLYIDRSNSKIKVIDGVEYIADGNGELRLANEPATTIAPTTQQVKQTQKAVAQTSTTVQAAAQVPPVIVSAETTSTEVSSQVAINTPPYANAIDVTNGTTNATVAPTTVVSTTAVKQTVTETAKSEPDENGGPGVGMATTTARNVVTETTASSSSGEIKILKTEAYKDTIDGSDYEESYDCTITLLKPTMQGATDEETDALNGCIEDIMDVWMEEMIGVVEEYSTFPKSITFTKAEITSTTKTRIIIAFTGNLKPKSGSSKSLKYRMVYNREEENLDISKVS